VPISFAIRKHCGQGCLDKSLITIVSLERSFPYSHYALAKYPLGVRAWELRT